LSSQIFLEIAMSQEPEISVILVRWSFALFVQFAYLFLVCARNGACGFTHVRPPSSVKKGFIGDPICPNYTSKPLVPASSVRYFGDGMGCEP
jgi:hypothetical protein